MAKKFYVVWAGRQTGVFTDWPTAHQSVDGFAGAKFKSFPTRAEADVAFKSGSPPRVTRPAKARQNQTATNESEADEVAPTNSGLRIYCDGACEPNPGNAGSGVVIYRDGNLAELWYGLYNPNGTNNTAELNALLSALLMVEKSGEPAQILCDSVYAINCVSKWAAGWERKGWRKADGEIKNLAIIQAAYAVYGKIESRVELIHVRGHAGNEGNELADRMAMHAVESREPHLRQWDGSLDVKTLLRMRRG
ncbi:MAG: viroplasmin family protein [Proteobacteria bacterium]|nr:viroplasmin family protein [Pseudomonadota bacterium]